MAIINENTKNNTNRADMTKVTKPIAGVKYIRYEQKANNLLA